MSSFGSTSSLLGMSPSQSSGIYYPTCIPGSARYPDGSIVNGYWVAINPPSSPTFSEEPKSPLFPFNAPTQSQAPFFPQMMPARALLPASGPIQGWPMTMPIKHQNPTILANSEHDLANFGNLSFKDDSTVPATESGSGSGSGSDEILMVAKPETRREKKIKRNFTHRQKVYGQQGQHQSQRNHCDSEPFETDDNKKMFSRIFCGFCFRNGERREYYKSHSIKDPKTGYTTCPILSKYMCRLCGATGPKAHTESYCPEIPTNKKKEKTFFCANNFAFGQRIGHRNARGIIGSYSYLY